MKKREKGNKGEEIIAEYLKKKGYKIIARNYFVKNTGEIDIIAFKDNTIVFVEVRSGDYSEYTVNYTKKKKIYKTSMDFLRKNPQYQDYLRQYDIVSVNVASGEIVHYENVMDI